MNDWEQFLLEVTWFLEPGQSAVVGTAQPWTRGSIAGLPELSALVESAALTPLRVGADVYELFAWGPPDYRRGWLCHLPPEATDDSVSVVHQRFWRVCGGIVERFGEPRSWWLNQEEVLTVEATRLPVAGVLADYAWIWKDEALTISIDPDEYYPVAIEANGNLTLAHRETGRLLLFAPDHSFSGVTPLAGSPPYSLMTMDVVPDLTTWIEVCAAAWWHP